MGCFHPVPGTPTLPSPDSAASGSFSYVVTCSSEFLRLNTRSQPFGSERTYQGLFPHRGMTRWSPHPRGDQAPLRSVLRLSQPLDGLLLRLASRAYSIPQPCPGFIPFRGFSLRTATLRFRSSSPLVVEPPAPRNLGTSPSLRPALGPSTSRFSSVRRCVHRARCLRSPSPAPLFRFLLLQVYPLV